MKRAPRLSTKLWLFCLGPITGLLLIGLLANTATAQTQTNDSLTQDSTRKDVSETVIDDEAVELNPAFDPKSLNLKAISGSILKFTVPKTNTNLPSARFGIRELLVLDADTGWLVLVAIEPSVLSGDYLIYFSYDDDDSDAMTIELSVAARAEQSASQDVELSLSDGMPAPAVTFTWPRELSSLDFENSTEPSIPFISPNKQLATATPTIIERAKTSPTRADALSVYVEEQAELLAPSQGIVVNLIESESQATILVLDHGRSMFSVFAFWGPANVALGAGVAQGQLLAHAVPHQNDTGLREHNLFWWLSLNNAILNPQILVDW